LLFASTSAWADEASSKRASELKIQGDAVFDQGKYADAYALYVQAYSVDPSPSLLYNQGRALEAMGEYPDAIGKLEDFQAKASPETIAKVPALGELMAGIRARISTLVVTCNVQGARVVVRDRIVGTISSAQKLETKTRAGMATVDVIAEGYANFHQEVDLTATQTITLDVKLVERKDMAVLVVRASPEGSLVSIDSKPVGPAPVTTKLKPGTYQLELQRPSYLTESMPITLAKGEKREIDVTLHKPPPFYAKWWFWTGVGAAVAGGVVLSIALVTEKGASSGSFSPGQVKGP
jgi:hypothetical protein